jgi:GT2 family glycosyltransferase
MPRGWGIELDYCYRAKQVGFSTNLIQTVSVHHYGGKSYSNREEHCHLSSNEMHSRLIEKYGENWYGILEYPQW